MASNVGCIINSKINSNGKIVFAPKFSSGVRKIPFDTGLVKSSAKRRIGDVYEETKVVVRCNDGSVVLNAEGKLSFKVGGKVHTMDVPESGKVAFKLVVAAVDSKGLVINSSQIEPKVEINIETDVESVTLTAGDVTVNGSAVNVKVDAGNVTSAGDVRAAVVEAGSVTAQTINSLRAENITVYADAVGEVKGGVVTVECKQCSECAPSDSGEKKKKKRK